MAEVEYFMFAIYSRKCQMYVAIFRYFRKQCKNFSNLRRISLLALVWGSEHLSELLSKYRLGALRNVFAFVPRETALLELNSLLRKAETNLFIKVC